MANRTKWSNEEDDQLLHELSTTMNIFEISAAHNRSLEAISYRQEKLAKKLLAEGYPRDQVAKMTRLNPADVKPEQVPLNTEMLKDIRQLLLNIDAKLNVLINKTEK